MKTNPTSQSPKVKNSIAGNKGGNLNNVNPKGGNPNDVNSKIGYDSDILNECLQLAFAGGPTILSDR